MGLTDHGDRICQGSGWRHRQGVAIDRLFQTPDQLRDKLKDLITAKPEICPRQLAKFSSFEEKALYLRDNYCELDLGEEGYLQWYLVRLEK